MKRLAFLTLILAIEPDFIGGFPHGIRRQYLTFANMHFRSK